MKNFLSKSLVFLLSIIVLFCLGDFIISRYIASHANFKIKTNPKYVVLGHSHSECAFNDSIIGQFKNLSKSAESYFYTYQKVREVLKQNGSIKTVFIEFSNNQIREGINDWIWGSTYMANHFPRYSCFMSASEKMTLIKHNPKGFYEAFSISLKKKLERIYHENFDCTDNIGGFLSLARDKTDSLLEAAKHSKQIKNQVPIEHKLSDYNITYLKKIIQLCEEKHVRVILVRSPMHEKYDGYENEEQYKMILKKEFYNIEYLDLSKFHLKDQEFADLDHLNYRGAQKFSFWFNNFINSDIMKTKIDQKTVDLILEESDKGA